MGREPLKLWDLVPLILRDFTVFMLLSINPRLLTDCGLVMPYRDIELGQHWLR